MQVCKLLGILAFSALVTNTVAVGAEEAITIVQSSPVNSASDTTVLGALPMALGYFAQEGIKATLAHANGSAAAGQVLQSGSAQFAETFPEVVMRMQEQGGDVVAAFTLGRDNGTEIAVLDNSPIRSLADLRGKALGALTWASGAGAEVKQSLADAGIKQDGFTQVIMPPGPTAAAALQSGQVDALAFWSSAYAAMRPTGIKLRIVEVPVGRLTAGLVLATTKKFAAEKPEIVAGVCRAMNKSYLFARTNPEAAIDLLISTFPSFKPAPENDAATRAQYKYVLDTWLKTQLLGLPPEAQWGGFDPSRWEFSHKFYTAGGQLKGTRQPADGYTDQFLAKCNDFDRNAIVAEAKAYVPKN